MCFDPDDGEQIERYRESTPVARKVHRCDECRELIAVGQQYFSVRGFCNNSPYSHKICRRCQYDRFRVVEHELAEGCHWSEAWPHYGILVEHLQDSGLGQSPPEKVPIAFEVTDEPGRPARQPA